MPSAGELPFQLRQLTSIANDTDWAGTHVLTGLTVGGGIRLPQRKTKGLQSIIVVVEPQTSGDAIVADRANGTFTIEGIAFYDRDGAGVLTVADVIASTGALASQAYHTPIEIPMPKADWYTVRLSSFAGTVATLARVRIVVVREIYGD